ncbi:HAD-IIB family hydrolase [Marinobacter bryozoorum]|uniref:HAD-IIB family hydrolase n=1 Tax=Marinobacter bryozoorum TaxID=256324 RepID=UPI0020052AAB|nr:HAD-IIB family hydrolase [Marinobacter bryozoorum]MCK7545747.1 HAD-IIB family hydrolase [Marinobacter bryozoorum]
MSGPALILFSDLDGTLLDHDTYDWSPAQAALEQLAVLEIPLVLTSSKTRAEMEALRRAMGNHHPFIVENGAATVIPKDYFETGPEQVTCLGAGRDDILAHLQRLRAQGFRFAGFADMTDEEVATHTGLDLEGASKARDRIATEPLLWQGPEADLAAFRLALEAAGLQLLAGGRFLHVMGRFDKADAMAQLARRYRTRWPGRNWRTVALGDSPNDQAMLAGADLAVVMAGPGASRITLPTGQRVMRSRQPGPVGWNECVLDILERDEYH